MRLLLALALASMSGACATLQGFETGLTTIPPPTPGGTAIYRSPADLRSIVVVQTPATTVTVRAPDGTTTTTNYAPQTVVCPQPPGDVGISRTAENTINIKVDGPTDATDGALEAAFRAGAAAAELAGRTPTVLLAREMLTFTCVQSALPPNATAQANFSRLADMLENFSEADRQRAAAAAVDAAANAGREGANAEVVQEIVSARTNVRETRTNAIVANLTLNNNLNTARLAEVANVPAVQQALGPEDTGIFRQIRTVPALRGFLIDIEPRALAVLETASKP